jgi:hypothetical protein
MNNSWKHSSLLWYCNNYSHEKFIGVDLKKYRWLPLPQNKLELLFLVFLQPSLMFTIKSLGYFYIGYKFMHRYQISLKNFSMTNSLAYLSKASIMKKISFKTFFLRWFKRQTSESSLLFYFYTSKKLCNILLWNWYYKADLNRNLIISLSLSLSCT